MSVVEQYRSVWGLVSAVVKQRAAVLHSPAFRPGDKLAPAEVLVVESPEALAALGPGGIRLVPGAEVVPRRVRWLAAGVELGCSSAGFDLSAFKRFGWSPVPRTVQLSKLRYRLLTEIFELETAASAASRIVTKATLGGKLDGILMWMELQFSDTETLDTRSSSSFSPLLQQFVGSREICAGETVHFFVRCLGRGGSFLVSLSEKPSVGHMPGNLPPLHTFPPTPLPSVLAWHFPMLADESRSAAYFEALCTMIAQCEEPPLVLDIGSGTGLLAMLAAKAGAGQVVGCEAVPFIADCARQCVAQNAPARCPITILTAMSTELVPGKTPGLPRKADIVVQEIMDAAVLGEGVLPSMSHAMQHLAKPHARAIPASARIFGALIGEIF